MRGPLVRNEKQLHPVGALDQVADPASACRQLIILRCTRLSNRAPHETSEIAGFAPHTWCRIGGKTKSVGFALLISALNEIVRNRLWQDATTPGGLPFKSFAELAVRSGSQIRTVR
jgi:hypothetical protein